MTVGSAVAAVLAVQRVAVAAIEVPPRFLLENYQEPAVITAVLVSVAVGVFVAIAREAATPRPTFFKVATAALLVSLLPDVAVGMGWLFVREGWALAIVFMLQHVAAWAVVVGVLPRMAGRRRTS